MIGGIVLLTMTAAVVFFICFLIVYADYGAEGKEDFKWRNVVMLFLLLFIGSMAIGWSTL